MNRLAFLQKYSVGFSKKDALQIHDDLDDVIDATGIATLRADLATAQATVAQQAAQLEQAREKIEYACETWPNRDDGYFRPDHENAMDDLRAWLAAHPAPARDDEELDATDRNILDSWHERL